MSNERTEHQEPPTPAERRRAMLEALPLREETPTQDEDAMFEEIEAELRR